MPGLEQVPPKEAAIKKTTTSLAQVNERIKKEMLDLNLGNNETHNLK